MLEELECEEFAKETIQKYVSECKPESRVDAIKVLNKLFICTAVALNTVADGEVEIQDHGNGKGIVTFFPKNNNNDENKGTN